MSEHGWTDGHSTNSRSRPRHSLGPDHVDGGHDRTARLPRRARVISVESLTNTGTVHVTLEAVDREPFEFVPGQFVAIDMEHPELGYRRSPYCIYSAPSAAPGFELLVRKVEDGPVSLFVTSLSVGDVISFRGPSGHSMIPKPEDRRLILLGTGVGLAPIHSLLSHILRSNAQEREIRLFWGLRLEDDICLLSELDQLANRLPDFSYMISLSQGSPGWPGLRGRLTESVPPLLKSLADSRFYLASNGAMIAEMSEALQEKGVSSSNIYEESFFNHRWDPDPTVVERICRRFVANDLQAGISALDIAVRARRER